MDKRGLFFGIEAGGSKFVCAAGYTPDSLVIEERFATAAPGETLVRVRSLLERVACEFGPIAGIGVAFFGPVDISLTSPNYGEILRTPKPDWSGINFVKALTTFGAPVFVETDVNGAGLAEFTYGAGVRAGTMAYVTVGTGIGAGIIKNGKILSGVSHYEMGHIHPPHNLAQDPFPGRCPFHGDCLEGLACGPSIIDRWGVPLSDLPPEHPALDVEANYLAYLAQTIILTHMPEKIIFGGGVMKAKGLIEKLRRRTEALLGGYLQASAFSKMTDLIVPPSLGDSAGVIGAMILAQGGSVASEA